MPELDRKIGQCNRDNKKLDFSITNFKRWEKGGGYGELKLELESHFKILTFK
jgi:hypothetical protein